jgi:hypothetical protein
VAIVIGVGVVAAIALLAWLSWKKEQERIRALQALAAELGLSFDAGEDHGLGGRYPQFEVFRSGRAQVASNTLRGSLELSGRSCTLLAGDFRYKVTTGSGSKRRTSTRRFSYLLLHPPWQSPPLLIRREGLFDKLKGALGFADIAFESTEFSRRFWVKSTDERFARDVLHPRMMEFLLAAQPPTVDIEGGVVCLVDGTRRWQPDEFRRQIAFARDFCNQWPQHLVKDARA